MAYPHSDTDAEQNLQTRCSNCLTVFEVSRELLASSDTRVRCGECLSIFDAREELRSEDSPEQPSTQHEQGQSSTIMSEEVSAETAVETPSSDTLQADTESAALAGLANDTAALDVTYSDFDLFSEDADLPEIAYFDQTRDTANFDFDTVALEEDETFSDTLFAHDVTIDANAVQTEAQQSAVIESAEVEFVSDDAPVEPLIFNYQDAEPGSTDTLTGEKIVDDPEEEPEFTAIETVDDRSGSWLFRGLLFFTLVTLLGSLYLYREKDKLYNQPIARPFLEAGCFVLRCEVPPRVDLSALQPVQRKAFSHPTVDDALVLTMGIRNDADFEQPLPVLEISLDDRAGRTVAKRDFFPKDYLDDWQEGDTIAAGKRLDISLEVRDPGNRATGFELEFRSMP